MADGFYAFVQNLTVAMTGTTHGALVLSLPRSQVEMTESDQAWQDRISKVVRRVAKDLIATDETEVSEIIRRRLFETIGREPVIHTVAKQYADWCFERRAQLPPEWTAVDTAVTEAKARDFLRGRFEACYPFHPATLSVFQRKWQGLAQYQQTRGTLAMLAQWISWAYRDGYQRARREPLITLGSAPLDVPEFRAVVLGQLGEPRLAAAMETAVVGELSHAKALDADTKGALKGIYRRVGLAILFESSGGMVEKVAHLSPIVWLAHDQDRGRAHRCMAHFRSQAAYGLPVACSIAFASVSCFQGTRTRGSHASEQPGSRTAEHRHTRRASDLGPADRASSGKRPARNRREASRPSQQPGGLKLRHKSGTISSL